VQKLAKKLSFIYCRKIIINTPTIYFGASTSSTGKHHPKVVNGLTGLVRHSVATMLTAKEFLGNDIIMKVFQMSELSELDKEIILAASLSAMSKKTPTSSILLQQNGRWVMNCSTLMTYFYWYNNTNRGKHGVSLFMLYPIGCSSRNAQPQAFLPHKG